MSFLIAFAVILLIAVGLLSFMAKKEARKLRESRVANKGDETKVR